MKHLRKYNENKKIFDSEYFNECFIEFIDSDSTSIELEEDTTHYYYYISINLPNVKFINNKWIFEKEETLEGNLKYSEELFNFYKDIDTCIEKVKIKYPNVKVDFDIEKEGNIRKDIMGDYSELFEAYVNLTLIININ